MRRRSALSPPIAPASKGLSRARDGGCKQAAELRGPIPAGVAREDDDGCSAVRKLDDIGAATLAQRDPAGVRQQAAVGRSDDADAEPVVAGPVERILPRP